MDQALCIKNLRHLERRLEVAIWIALSVYVLVTIGKRRLNLDAPPYTLLQILSLILFEKMPLQQAFPGNKYISQQGSNNQLNLFTF